jgi:hypothetical protein
MTETRHYCNRCKELVDPDRTPLVVECASFRYKDENRLAALAGTQPPANLGTEGLAILDWPCSDGCKRSCFTVVGSVTGQYGARNGGF